MAISTSALVLAGGGVAGIAWELGVLRGIADVDAALADRLMGADVVVGTSAGASVAAQITSGVALTELYDAQLRPETAEIEVEVDIAQLFAGFVAAMDGAADAVEAARRVGAIAVAATTPSLSARLAAVDARLPVKTWPTSRDLRVTAVDADTGELSVFTSASGVSLLDAVAASGAVPGVWPPVPIGGRRFIDGGARSLANADLAAGSQVVLLIQPALEGAPQLWGDLSEELAALAPADVLVISADPASIEAFGPNPLSPATRSAAARAGRRVGAARAHDVAARWERA